MGSQSPQTQFDSIGGERTRLVAALKGGVAVAEIVGEERSALRARLEQRAAERKVVDPEPDKASRRYRVAIDRLVDELDAGGSARAGRAPRTVCTR